MNFLSVDNKQQYNCKNNYKIISPTKITHKVLDYNFPDDNSTFDCTIDRIHFLVKIDGADVEPFDDISIDDFVKSVEYFYRESYSFDEKKLLPIEFIKTFNIVNKYKSKTCYEIPLLKMQKNDELPLNFSSNSYLPFPAICPPSKNKLHVTLRINKSENYKNTLLNVYAAKYGMDIDSLMKVIRCDNYDKLFEQIEPRFDFKIVYRETQHMDPFSLFDSYIFDKCNIEFDGSAKSFTWLSDTGNHFNYKYILIILKAEPEIILNEVEIKTNEKLSDNIFVLSKEIAEIFGEQYQINSTHYLINIDEYINSNIKSFIVNKIERTRPIDMIFEEGTFDIRKDKHYNANVVCGIDENKCSLNMDVIAHKILCSENTNLRLKISLTLNKKSDGCATVYFF